MTSTANDDRTWRIRARSQSAGTTTVNPQHLVGATNSELARNSTDALNGGPSNKNCNSDSSSTATLKKQNGVCRRSQVRLSPFLSFYRCRSSHLPNKRLKRDHSEETRMYRGSLGPRTETRPAAIKTHSPGSPAAHTH